MPLNTQNSVKYFFFQTEISSDVVPITYERRQLPSNKSTVSSPFQKWVSGFGRNKNVFWVKKLYLNLW